MDSRDQRENPGVCITFEMRESPSHLLANWKDFFLPPFSYIFFCQEGEATPALRVTFPLYPTYFSMLVDSFPAIHEDLLPGARSVNSKRQPWCSHPSDTQACVPSVSIIHAEGHVWGLQAPLCTLPPSLRATRYHLTQLF